MTDPEEEQRDRIHEREKRIYSIFRMNNFFIVTEGRRNSLGQMFVKLV